jgi:uncharacterized membrane protein
MKTVISIVFLVALAALCGCQTSESPQGGSVTKSEGFKISVPYATTTMKQGDVQTAVVTLQRDDYFKQNVRLLINTTKGISLDPTSVLIKSNDKPEVQIRISVAKDAALGDYGIRVMGTPETGEPTSTVFTVKVVSP